MTATTTAPSPAPPPPPDFSSLTAEQIERFGEEMNAIRQRVLSELGERRMSGSPWNFGGDPHWTITP